MDMTTSKNYITFDINRSGIQELQKDYKNNSNESFLLTDGCFQTLTLPPSFCHIDYYSSSWGKEFTKLHQTISETFSFSNTKGRCSAESAPFFTLSSDSLHIDVAICTSGNYKVILIPTENSMEICICEADENFSTIVSPFGIYLYPRILAHVYQTLTECYQEKQAYRKEHLRSHPVYSNLPLIYNHWWAYEDCEISEDVILKNAELAKDLGFEMLVLDAGWFGNDSLTEEWFSVRGDWNLVNKERFPKGLTYLRNELEKLGLLMGIWCEIEGVGSHALLAKSHPEYLAVRDKKNLGYVCFGNPDVQEWAYRTMSDLFDQCGAAYWKLDFNLDPGLGCNSMDYDPDQTDAIKSNHSHTKNDGLNAHYKGLYHVLDRLQKDYPELIIENCSSGGQRFNLEMAEHTHTHFLSDPDYSVHQMRVFKEASKWLLPKQLLHFMWSNTVSTEGSAPFQNLNLELLSDHELRYHMRLAMMHQFGMSHRLTDYSKETRNRIRKNLMQYKTLVRPFISNGSFLPLYLSEHINIFSFCTSQQSLLFLFAEKKGEALYSLKSLLKDQTSCQLVDIDEKQTVTLSLPTDIQQHFYAGSDWTSKLLLLQT